MTLFSKHSLKNLFEVTTHTGAHIGVRGGGGGLPPGLKNFRANSVFRATASSSKILNHKIYFSTAKNSRATLFFRASASC